MLSQMIHRIFLLFLLFGIFSQSNAMDALFYSKNCSWIEKTSMPTARSEFSTITYKNKIYVLGGLSGSHALNNFEVYDTISNQWQILSSSPIKVHHGALGLVNNKIYLIGGFTDITWERPNYNIYEYNLEKNSWKEYDHLSITRVGHTIESINEEIFIIGGHGYRPSRILIYSPLQKKIREIERMMPLPADHLASLINNDNLIIFGGRDGSGNLSIIRIYQLAKSKWLYNDSLPFATSGHIASLVKNKIHILGGEDIINKQTFNKHWFYDLKQNKWFESVKLPTGLHGLGSGVVRNKLYIFGGAKGAGDETYNSVQNKNYLLKCF